MTITVRQFNARAALHQFENVVSVSGLTVSLAAGAFKIAGSDYNVATQQDFVCTPDVADVVHVRGYVAHDNQSGNQVLVVDEFKDTDPAFRFDDDPDLDLLHRVFSFDMAANETDLANSAIEVHHVVNPSAVTYAQQFGLSAQEETDRAANRAQVSSDVTAEKALYDAWVGEADPAQKMVNYAAWQAHINP